MLLKRSLRHSASLEVQTNLGGQGEGDKAAFIDVHRRMKGS